ncbi:MAG TPA: discoidin domain-containing protein, partial [Polyangia bacterium]|nr:discoidin domain-containing protein [Polyangia bacterium]
TTSPKRVVQTGTAGSTGSAGSGSAGETGTAGNTGGTAGNTGGTAGNTGGTAGAAAGTTGGTAGAAAGTTGGTAGAGGADAGSTAGTTGGTAGNVGGTAGTTAGTAGTAAPMICMNSTVVTQGGTQANCGPQSGWTATAMPTPNSGLDGIMDNQLLPKYAIDGSLTTRYSSGMTMAAGDYFQVDLGATKMVSGIIVTSTENMDGTYDVADGYTVGLSTDGNNFTTVSTCAAGSSASSVETVNFAATMARYVRYTNMGPPIAPPSSATAWLSIQEFDVTCN